MQALADDRGIDGRVFSTGIDKVCNLASVVLGEAEVLSVIVGCEEMLLDPLQRYAQLPRTSWVCPDACLLLVDITHVCRRTFWLPVVGPREVVVSWIECPDVRCLQSFLGTSVPSPTQAVLCFLDGFTTKELLVWPEVRKLRSRGPAWQIAVVCSNPARIP